MSLFISSFKKIRKERVVVLLPFLVLFVLAFHWITPETDAYRLIEETGFWKNKTFDKKKYDVVLCGDSRTYRGISPVHMNEILPDYDILNFGYSSGGFANNMFREIDKRIDENSDKKIIVLGLTPFSLTPKGARNEHLTDELNTKREEIIEMLYFKRVFQFFIPFTFIELERSIKGKEYSFPFAYEYYKDGWVASDSKITNPTSAIQSYSKVFTNNKVSNVQIEKVMNKITSWKAKNVQVIAFRPPTTMMMEELEDSLSGYDEVMIREQVEEAGAIWLEFNTTDYYSYDGSHLQKESAIRFSRDLAGKIKDCLILP